MEMPQVILHPEPEMTLSSLPFIENITPKIYLHNSFSPYAVVERIDTKYENERDILWELGLSHDKNIISAKVYRDPHMPHLHNAVVCCYSRRQAEAVVQWIKQNFKWETYVLKDKMDRMMEIENDKDFKPKYDIHKPNHTMLYNMCGSDLHGGNGIQLFRQFGMVKSFTPLEEHAVMRGEALITYHKYFEAFAAEVLVNGRVLHGQKLKVKSIRGKPENYLLELVKKHF